MRLPPPPPAEPPPPIDFIDWRGRVTLLPGTIQPHRPWPKPLAPDNIRYGRVTGRAYTLAPAVPLFVKLALALAALMAVAWMGMGRYFN